MENIKKERTVATVISWSTFFIQVLISIFFVPFFLGKVGDKEYGLYSFSSSLISWIDTLVIAFISAYYRFLTREKKNHGEKGESETLGVFLKIFFIVFLIVLVFGLGFNSLIFFKIIPLNEYTSSEVNKISLIILMSILSSSITSLLNVGKAYPYYKQKYIFAYIIPLLQVILQTGLSVVALKLGCGVVVVALIHFGTMAILSSFQMLYSRVFLGMRINLKSSGEDKAYKKMLTKEILIFTSFILLNTVVDIFNKNIDKILLGFRNADSVSVYQLALTIPNYLISFTSIISVVFSQKVNDAYYNGEGIKEIDEIFLKASKIQFLLTFLLVGGFLACGKDFIILWIGKERLTVFYIACILMVLYSLTCSNGLNVAARRATNNHKKAAVIYLGIVLTNAIASIVTMLLIDKQYAIWACVLGTFVTYILGQWVLMQIYDKKTVGISTDKFFKDFILYFIVIIPISILISFVFDLIKISNMALFIIKGCVFVIFYLLFVLLKDRIFVFALLKGIKNGKEK